MQFLLPLQATLVAKSRTDVRDPVPHGAGQSSPCRHSGARRAIESFIKLQDAPCNIASRAYQACYNSPNGRNSNY